MFGRRGAAAAKNGGTATATPPPPATSTEVDLLILCLGSRGDVQPFLNLAVFCAAERGHRVVLACHPEYRPLVEAAAAASAAAAAAGSVTHAPLQGSFTDAMRKTPAGRALREARTLRAALDAADAFFSPLAKIWAADVRALVREHRPRLVLHSTFTLFSSFAAPFAAAEDINRAAAATGSSDTLYSPRVAVAHTVPSQVTSAFAPPTTGQGLELPLFGRLFAHRLAWRLGFWAADRAVYKPLTRAAAEVLLPTPDASSSALAASPLLLPTWRDAERLAGAPTPSLYIWSPSLVPRPADWHESACVVGGLLTRAQEQEPEPVEAQGDEERQQAVLEHAGVPRDVARALCEARRHGRPVVFATLGSMLGAVLEGREAQRALEALARGAGEAAAVAAAADYGGGLSAPPLVIIHATTGKRDGEDSRGSPAVMASAEDGGGGDFDLPALERAVAEANAAFSAGAAASSSPSSCCCLLLTVPVPHAILLPRCDLVLHHGGAGTTHATLVAGRPSLPLPCAHASDQPWWADVLRRHGCAPPRGALPRLAVDLTPAAFAKALEQGLRGFGGGGGGGGGQERQHGNPYASLRRAAEAMGARIRAERGTAHMADELERLMSGPPAAPPPAPWPNGGGGGGRA